MNTCNFQEYQYGSNDLSSVDPISPLKDFILKDDSSQYSTNDPLKYVLAFVKNILVVNTKKNQRHGRWSKAQKILFQSLLLKYGNNWKKIHQHMTHRSLCQIRSHGQKYFDKITPTEKLNYKKTKHLLESYQILQSELCLLKNNPLLQKQSNKISAIQIIQQKTVKQQQQEEDENKIYDQEQRRCFQEKLKLKSCQKFMDQFYLKNRKYIVSISNPSPLKPYKIQTIN